MQYEYNIIYDIKKDIWNWQGALEDYFDDKNYAENIKRYSSDAEQKIVEQIVGIDQKTAKLVLEPYLLGQKLDSNSQLNKFIKLAKLEFKNKYKDACIALEKITGRPMMSDKFTFYVTTFPRMPYFYDEREIFMYTSTDGVWGMPIDGFLHEGLHFQFINYWQNDKTSPVSKLDDDKFFYIKEALTVILDEELMPTITLPDCSYQYMQPFRDILHAHWKKHHDFNKLVEFGLKELPKYAP